MKFGLKIAAMAFVGTALAACGGNFDKNRLITAGFEPLTEATMSALDGTGYECNVETKNGGVFVAYNNGFIFDNIDGPMGRGDYVVTQWLNSSVAQYAILKLEYKGNGDISYRGMVYTEKGNLDEFYETSSRVDILYNPETDEIAFADFQGQYATATKCLKAGVTAPKELRDLISGA